MLEKPLIVLVQPRPLTSQCMHVPFHERDKAWKSKGVNKKKDGKEVREVARRAVGDGRV